MNDSGQALHDLEPKLDRAIDEEYSAVSSSALLAVVLAVLSPPALGISWLLSFEIWLFNLVPLAALVLALIGLRSIKHSGGTVSGRRMALAGLAVGALFFAGGIVLHANHYLKQRALRAEVLELVFAQCDHLQAGNPGQVHDRLNESFRQQWPRKDFVEYNSRLMESTGPVQRRQVMSVKFFVTSNGTLNAKVFVRLKGKASSVNVESWFARSGPGRWRREAFKAGPSM